MRTLHAYILREVLVTTVMTVVVFSSILLLGTVLKEVAYHLASGALSPGDAARALAFLIPYVWAYALPMAMLTAVLLTFGRLSADQEITAARASGVSLVALISPVLLLSVAVTVVSAVCTLQVSPACRQAQRELIYRILTERPGVLMMEDRYVTVPTEQGDAVVYVGQINGEQLQDVLLYLHDTNGTLQVYVHAQRGQMLLDKTNGSVVLKMSDPVGGRFEKGKLETMPIGGDWYTPAISLATLKQRTNEPRVADLTLRPLLARIAAARTAGIDATRELVELHQRLSLSFACLGFTLVGIPLGIRAHRRETSVGIALGIGMMLLFYVFFIAGQSLRARPEYLPHLIGWIPNFLLFAVGLPLLRRANHGG